MKHKNANLPLLLLGIVVTISSVLLYVYMYKVVSSSFDRALVASSILATHKADGMAERSTEDVYNRTKEYRDRLSLLFVSESDGISFIESLEGIGRVAGSEVSLSSVTVDDTSKLKSGLLARIGARVDVKGSWQSVFRTLMLSESMPYDIIVDSVNINLEGGVPSSKSKIWRAAYNVKASMLIGSKTPKI